MTAKPVRVLIVDDSALIRQMLSEMLSSDPGIEVLGAVPDPLVARQKIKELNPDVITLDIEMPRMDGIEFLKKIMSLRPMPVVMVSTLTQHGADATLHALEIGAVDYVAKPTQDIQVGLEDKRAELVAKVKTAARANVMASASRAPAGPRLEIQGPGYSSTEKIVAIGASTGGVEALTAVLSALPADSPAILITQHMPASFTSTFARRLDRMCAIQVSEAKDGARVLPGHAYIAPGDRHLRLARNGANYVCKVGGQELVTGHCPSVDVLFDSVASHAGQNAVGVILTGMGKDGAIGLQKMRVSGARTLGQDEASCVVYGMPRVAFEVNAVELQLPLSKIASEILAICTNDNKVRIRV
jgi:two-component system chemotaxis response regulator CheB